MYYNDFDKQIIERIIGCDAKGMKVFGKVVTNDLFKVGSCALLLKNDGAYLFTKGDKDFKVNFGILTNVLSLIKQLENNNLIFVVDMETPKEMIFYEGSNNDEGLKPYGIDGRDRVLSKIVKHYFNSLIYKTSKLEEFVRNGYKTQEELHHEQVMENAEKQVKSERYTLILSIIAIIISAISLFIELIG